MIIIKTYLVNDTDFYLQMPLGLCEITAQNAWTEKAHPAKSSLNPQLLYSSQTNYTVCIQHPFYMINKYSSPSIALVLYTTTTVIQYRSSCSKTLGIVTESAFKVHLPEPLLDLVMVSGHMEPRQYSPRWRHNTFFSSLF